VPWLLLRAPELLKDEERVDLERVLAADALLTAGYALVQRFRVALHDLDATAFKRWLLDAAASELKPFARLAAGKTDDLQAMTNAFRFPWSTGPVEGHATALNSSSAPAAAAPSWLYCAPESWAATEPSRQTARASSKHRAFTGCAGEPKVWAVDADGHRLVLIAIVQIGDKVNPEPDGRRTENGTRRGAAQVGRGTG
jgi:hypothetical protein